MHPLQLSVKLYAASKCVAVPGGHVLVGATGFFVREIQLPVGTPVLVEFCQGQDKVALSGRVSTSYDGLGLSVEFDERSRLAVRKLSALLAA
jgi:hypothetical protein